MGVDVASLRRRPRPRRAGARACAFVDERTADLQEAGAQRATARACSAASWSATPRSTARCCSWCRTALPLPEAPEQLILPARDGDGKPAPRRGRAARRRADLLLQQRQQGRPLRRHRRRARRRSARSRSAPRPARSLRRVRAAGDADPEGRARRAGRRGQQPPLRALSRTRGRSSFTWSASADCADVRRAARASTAAAWAARSASRPWRRSSPRAGTSIVLAREQGAASGHERPLPGQHSAGRHRIRSCRASPAARSRRSSSS